MMFVLVHQRLVFVEHKLICQGIVRSYLKETLQHSN